MLLSEILSRGQYTNEVRVKSGVPQGNVFGPLLFLAYVNDIRMIIEFKIRLFADDFIIYKKIVNNRDLEILQTDLDASELLERVTTG
jgi:hypothetical protein